MRFEQYLNEESTNVLGYVFLSNELNEVVSDSFLFKLQALGQKMGLKVRKSRTFQQQLSNAGSGVLDLMKIVFEYSVHADIFDTSARKKLEQEIKDKYSKVRKEDVISFIVNIDKTFLGITSIPRHILQNILGITITSYDNWQTNNDYVSLNMEKIIMVLDDMKDEENAILARKIYTNVTGKTYKRS